MKTGSQRFRTLPEKHGLYKETRLFVYAVFSRTATVGDDMFPISERLKTVAAMVPACHTVADIGTDHGYVPAFLIRTGQCVHVIASDIAEGPCAAARETQARYGLQDVMEVRKAPGLQGLKIGEAQAVVIAGMGGATILRILEERPDITDTVETFVLQPMNAANLLRQWLTEHNFAIVEETLCKENDHIYIIMKAVHTAQKQELSEMEQELGPCILKNKPVMWPEYITEKAERCHHLLTQMEHSETAKQSEKYKTTQKLLKQLEQERGNPCQFQ